MPDKVVDASAISALLFGEPKAARVAESLEGARLAAPALIDYEVSSVCLKKVCLHPERRQSLLGAYRLLMRLPMDRYGVDGEATLLLAEDTGLSVYDASYLWLARSLRAELVTLDRSLAAVARRTLG
ncbi:MAG: type II toxin-antitoxin system VapC family toxin [Deltaproteobacteria bacterium]|nr:type II toxin-antitoxin system VapC family toxin [Deltaproteobacteria bacterium]